MSVSNLLVPNDCDLYCNTITAKSPSIIGVFEEALDNPALVLSGGGNITAMTVRGIPSLPANVMDNVEFSYNISNNITYVTMTIPQFTISSVSVSNISGIYIYFTNLNPIFRPLYLKTYMLPALLSSGLVIANCDVQPDGSILLSWPTAVATTFSIHGDLTFTWTIHAEP